MQIDPNKLQQILCMDEYKFKELVYQAVYNTTKDVQKAQMAMGIAPMIREKLRYADQKELEKVFMMLGEEKMRELMRSL